MLDLEVKKSKDITQLTIDEDKGEVILLAKVGGGEKAGLKAENLRKKIELFRDSEIASQREDELRKPLRNQFLVEAKGGEVILTGNIEHIFHILSSREIVPRKFFATEIATNQLYKDAVDKTKKYVRPDYEEVKLEDYENDEQIGNASKDPQDDIMVLRRRY